MTYLPTDFEIKSMVFGMWNYSLNLELRNIAACLHSQYAKGSGAMTDEFEKYVHTRLKALVKNGDLRRQRFLPGRPFYTIG